MPQGERRETVLHVVRRQEIVLSGGKGSSGSTSSRRASAGKLFCAGGGKQGGRRLFWAGEWGVQARRAAAGPAPGDCSAWGSGAAAGYCSGWGKGAFGLEEFPQGERRETVLRGGWGDGERQEIGLSGRRANSGSETCRRASAGILFCVGEQRRGGAAGYCYEREIGELGLEELPRGERRETVLRGAKGGGGGGRRLF